MVRSMLIKVAMLAVTLGSLVWIGSVTPVRKVPPPHVQQETVAPLSPVSRPFANRPSTASAPSPVVAMSSEVSNDSIGSAVAFPVSPASAGSPEAGTTDSLRRVDLNRATASDLETLPGIGPKLAHRVIEHRTSHGPFKRVEDLRQVKGIGHKKFDQLRSHVLVTHADAPSRPKGAL